MAPFKFFLKDLAAKSIDCTSVLDEKLQKANWLEMSAQRILANRSGVATVGSTLVYSTQGWHRPSQVNNRCDTLFQHSAFSPSDAEILEKLWILRHSVPHNAGMVVHYDATRIGAEALAEHAADIDAKFIQDTFGFLNPVARKASTNCGTNLLRQFFEHWPSAARTSPRMRQRTESSSSSRLISKAALKKCPHLMKKITKPTSKN